MSCGRMVSPRGWRGGVVAVLYPILWIAACSGLMGCGGLKLDLGSLDRSYDGTIIRANQQSQSSEQPSKRTNHLSNWKAESIK